MTDRSKASIRRLCSEKGHHEPRNWRKALAAGVVNEGKSSR